MDNLKPMVWPPINRMFSWNDNLYILGDKNAALSRDFELAKEHNVTVSPTLIFNEGRQRLNGNVGYRVIEANIRELLHNPPDEQSWC
jgi:predicted DsbA family dithiol-disulfide isomerase